MKLVFIQSFSLADVCGGAKILRSVAEDAPVPVASISTGFGRNRGVWNDRECILPFRPYLGRIDRTRFSWLGGYVEALLSRRFERRIERELVRLRATDVHLLPHGWGDFAAAFRAAMRLGLRIHVSIHDDLLYTAKGHPMLTRMEPVLGDLWRDADNRFVISPEMGEEYARRYGERSYLVHTDGCEKHEMLKFEPPASEVNLYFMGMFNNSYAPNFQALLTALDKHQSEIGKGLPVRFTVRTHGFNSSAYPGRACVRSLPFASPAIVEAEMRSQHLLYLPLPLDPEWENLCRFSLSTKMVSYLAAGVPIVYHGPESSAAGQYLRRNNAAIQINTNHPEAIARVLGESLADTRRLGLVSENAQNAARKDFDKMTLRSRFWDAVLKSN